MPTPRHAQTTSPSKISRRRILQTSALTAAAVAGGASLAPTASAAQTMEARTGPYPLVPHGEMPRSTSDRDSGILAPNEKSFSDIDGTQTMYIRGGDREPATFSCTFGFYDEMVLWVQRLRTLSADAGFPALSFITSAGAYVNKPGQHGAGTAIDIDEIGWEDGRISRMIGLDWQNDDRSLRKLYYAVDATLRSHFHWSLDHTFNTAHHDHIHSDFGGMPVLLSTGSSSDVGWVQAACNEFMDAGLTVDQDWGPLTQAAFDESRTLLGTTDGDPHADTEVYRTWLDAVASRGFSNEPF